MRRLMLLGLHWAIILNFLFEMVYASYMIFFVIKPELHSGPLGQAAMSIPHEMMVTRRLYALEFWIATAGFAVYVALTEMVPRLTRMRAEASA